MIGKHFRVGVVALMAAAFATPAFAVESGLSPYLKGTAGFMSGYVPPQPGVYLTDTYYYFHGSVGSEVRGGNIELGVDTTLNADLLQGIYVTDAHLFGATYAVGVTVDYVWAGLDASLATPLGTRNISLNQDGISDSIVTPVLLGWHEGNFHWNLGVSVYIPTGGYDTNELSVGKNIWALMPQFGMTYFDPASGLDLSGTLTYVSMSKNDATDYQSGDLLHLDWAVGKHFGAGGAWEAGIGGNVMEQIGADRGAGAKLGPFKAQSFGVGPALSYSTKLGSTPLSLNAKWEHDFDTRNTFKGDVVTAAATIVF
jgi:hypothetical protein